MTPNSKSTCPDKLKQEIRNLVYVHSRELVMRNKASGAKQDKQEKIIEKAFHGTESHQSFLRLFLEGKALYDSCFEKKDMENNQEGNDAREDGQLLELLPVLHLQYGSNCVVDQKGFTREAIDTLRINKIKGRNLNERALNVIAMHRLAVAYSKRIHPTE